MNDRDDLLPNLWCACTNHMQPLSWIVAIKGKTKPCVRVDLINDMMNGWKLQKLTKENIYKRHLISIW